MEFDVILKVWSSNHCWHRLQGARSSNPERDLPIIQDGSDNQPGRCEYAFGPSFQPFELTGVNACYGSLGHADRSMLAEIGRCIFRS